MEINTFADFGHEKKLSNGMYLRVDRTKDPKRAFVRLADLPERPAESHVRHRKKRRLRVGEVPPTPKTA